MNVLSERIRILREKAGLSLTGLGAVVGVTRQAVMKWENGDTANLKLANLVRLCQHFGITADDLLASELKPANRALAYENAPGIANIVTAREPGAPQNPARDSASIFPGHLERAYEALSNEGKLIVNTQLEIALETARRLDESRPGAHQTAA